jgi:hypothetical protein
MTAPLPLATPTDLATWLGQTIASEDARATAVLAGASALVRSRARKTWLNDAEDALEDFPDAVATVVVQVAARVWVNPQGLVASEAGDANRRVWAPSAGNGLYLTDSEKEIVDAHAASNRTGLWTLRTTRDDPCGETVYVPVEDAPPFPWYVAGEWPL